MRTKQVIIIRKDLNCRRGKEISQGAHCSLKVITDNIIGYPFSWAKFPFMIIRFVYLFLTNKPLRAWLTGSFRKITLIVNSEEELKSLYEQAKAKKILCSLILDSGKTEFHGVPTYTAVAIGPDLDERIDPITSHLKTY